MYEYVGKGNGDYLPISLLPLARSHNLTDLQLTVKPIKSLSIRSETAISQFDLNTFSDIDDDDNLGKAFNVSGQLTSQPIKLANRDLGKLSFAGRYRSIQEKFQPIERVGEIEFNRKWGISGQTVNKESINEFHANYSPVVQFQIRAGVGNIKRGEFRSKRREFGTVLTDKHLPQIDYRIEQIESERPSSSGDWIRQLGKTHFDIWKFRPGIRYEGEIKKDRFKNSDSTNGLKFDDIKGGIEFIRLPGIKGKFEYGIRYDNDFVKGEFKDRSTAKTQTYQLDLKEWRNLSTFVSYTHRTRDFTKTYEDQGLLDKKTDLSDWQMKYSPFKRAVRMDWRYQISTERIAKKEKVYIDVGTNRGNLRFDEDLNEFVPDANGNFVFTTITTGQFEPVAEVRANLRLRLSPKQIFKKKKKFHRYISKLSSETLVRIEERSRNENTKEIYLLNLRKFQNDSTTVQGTITFRQDLFLLGNASNLSIRLRYETRDSRNNQFIDGSETRESEERSLRIKKRIRRKFSIQTKYTNEIKDRVSTSRNKSEAIRGNQIDIDASYRPKQIIEFAVKGRYGQEKDKAPLEDTQVTLFSLIPRFNYSFLRKGRFRSQFEWTKVTVSPENIVIPFEMANGNRKGESMRWNIGLDYRASKFITITFNYNGTNEAGRDTIHTGQAEVRAFF